MKSRRLAEDLADIPKLRASRACSRNPERSSASSRRSRSLAASAFDETWKLEDFQRIDKRLCCRRLRSSRCARETGLSVTCLPDRPAVRELTENPTLREFRISARCSGGNAGMAKSCRDNFALDAFSGLGSFRLVRHSVGIQMVARDGIDLDGHPLDLKSIALHRRDLRRPACLLLRSCGP